MAEPWQEALQGARLRLGLSRSELARWAALSPDSIRAYEQGRRRPSAQALTAVLDALRLDRTEANGIRLALGYAPDSRDFGTPSIADQYTVDELTAELELLPWPAFGANELMEVVAANGAAQKLWGVDLSTGFPVLAERNLLRVASMPRFADRCLNWDEAIGVMVGMWKGHHRGAESLEAPSAYFQQVIEHFTSGDPAYVRRFLNVWERTPPRRSKIRLHYRVSWRDPGVGDMRFLCVQSAANVWEALGWNDWVPSDAESWRRLEVLLSLR